MKKNKKYEMIGKRADGLKRIRALKNFGDVKKGDIGGWIQSKENLSSGGNCWVYDNAVVRDKALVSGNAKIKDYAIVREKASVSGDTLVCDHSIVKGGALVDICKSSPRSKKVCGIFGYSAVSGQSIIFGPVVIEGDSHICGTARLVPNESSPSVPNRSFLTVLGVYMDCGNITWKTKLVRAPIYLSNCCEFHVTAYNEVIKIGCKVHTVEDWKKIYKHYRLQCRDFKRCCDTLFYVISLLEN